MRGTVARLLPTPRGEVDGFLLDDGRLVRFPPHMSAELMATVGQGDAVAIDGMQGPGWGGEFRAWRITNMRTGRSVTEAAPQWPPSPRAFSESDMRVNGTVRRVLTGARGETNGVILDDGTVVRFPPHIGEAFADIIAVGRPLVAQGYGSAGPAGRAIEAVALGTSDASLMQVEPGGPRLGAPPAGPPRP